MTVSWNLSVSEITDNNIKRFEVNTSEETTDILCKPSGTSWINAPEPIKLTTGVSITSDTYLPDTLVGWALNGIPFVQALSSNNEDILYPLEVGGSSRPSELTLDMQEDHDVCGTTLGFYPKEDEPDNIVYFLAYKLLPACLFEVSTDNVKSKCS